MFASSCSTYPPPSLLLSENWKCVSATVPLHLSTLIHRWGDNCSGMIVKEIIGVSIPPDRSWSELGFWPAAQVSIYSAGGRAPLQTRLETWRQNSEEGRRWPCVRGMESEAQDVGSWGECSHTLDYPFNEATPCHCFITLRKEEKSRFRSVVPAFPTARLASVLFVRSSLPIISSLRH